MSSIETQSSFVTEGLSPHETEPYKKIFTEIELTHPHPIDAYALFRTAADDEKLDPIFYTPMAITTGGYGRDINLGRGESIQKNTEYGQLAVKNLLKSIPGSRPDDFIIPSQLGKVKDWSQADYLIFFMHIIAGLDPYEALVVEENIGLEQLRQMPGFVSEELDFETRWDKGYKYIPERYVEIIKKQRLGKGLDHAELPKNIQANILILDPVISLGTNAERYLGHLLGIGEYAVSIDNPTDESVTHRKKLKALGANIVSLNAKREISGRQNIDGYWQMRNEGFKFRKPGVLTAIWDKELSSKKV